MKNDNRAVNDLVDIIRDIIRQEIAGLDSTVLCQIKSKKGENHYDVTIVPDDKTVVRNVVNMTKFDLEVGDYVYIFKIKNQLSNSFIFYKVTPYNGG